MQIFSEIRIRHNQHQGSKTPAVVETQRYVALNLNKSYRQL